MKRTLIIALATAFAASSGGTAQAESMMGTVSTFAFGYCPKYWAAADGSLLSIQQYSALYSLFGTQYGGNGTTTFALPKVSVLTAPGSGGSRKLTVCVATSGIYPSRD